MTASGFTPEMRERLQNHLRGMELAAAKGRGYFADCVLSSTPETLEADATALRALLAEVDEWRQSFDLYQRAIVRGTELWRAEDPEHRQLVAPDTGKLVAWLLALVDGAAPDGAASPETDVGPQPKEVMPPESRQRSRLDVSGDSVAPSVSEAAPFTCEGCGATVPEAERVGNGHTRSEVDEHGDETPVQCGPLSQPEAALCPMQHPVPGTEAYERLAGRLRRGEITVREFNRPLKRFVFRGIDAPEAAPHAFEDDGRFDCAVCGEGPADPRHEDGSPSETDAGPPTEEVMPHDVGYNVQCRLQVAPSVSETAPRIEAEVDRILELVSAWRDADWAFDHEPYNVDAPSAESCRFRDLRLAALRKLITALRELIGQSRPLSDAEREERERLARIMDEFTDGEGGTMHVAGQMRRDDSAAIARILHGGSAREP